MCVNKKDNWIDPIKGYLKNAALLMDKRQVEKNKKEVFSLLYGEQLVIQMKFLYVIVDVF